MFATPISEDVRKSVFGPEHVDRVKELHRFHILDVTPRNTESWFLSRVLKKLRIDRSDLWAILSFSDTTYGHTGVIYQATNAYRLGTSHGRTAYMDREGRLRSCHQKGTYLKKADAEALGWKVVWTKKKYKYLWLLPQSKAHKKELIKMCRYDLTHQHFH